MIDRQNVMLRLSEIGRRMGVSAYGFDYDTSSVAAQTNPRKAPEQEFLAAEAYPSSFDRPKSGIAVAGSLMNSRLKPLLLG